MGRAETNSSMATETSNTSEGRPRLNILLAEDDANLRGMLAIVLRREGHTVQEFRNGGDLHAHLTHLLVPGETLPRDLLIVADLRMPEMDGLMIVRALRQSGLQPPFILLTAFGSPEVHAMAHGLGAVEVLDKPFDFDDLRAVIRTHARAQATDS
jgi:DNA-binding response OmpR family regulator